MEFGKETRLVIMRRAGQNPSSRCERMKLVLRTADRNRRISDNSRPAESIPDVAQANRDAVVPAAQRRNQSAARGPVRLGLLIRLLRSCQNFSFAGLRCYVACGRFRALPFEGVLFIATWTPASFSNALITAEAFSFPNPRPTAFARLS
jgi:hypothetical protein